MNTPLSVREKIANCFKRNLMQTEGDTELFDTELTIDEIAALFHQEAQRIEREARLDENEIWIAHSTSRHSNDDDEAIATADFKERIAELAPQEAEK